MFEFDLNMKLETNGKLEALKSKEKEKEDRKDRENEEYKLLNNQNLIDQRNNGKMHLKTLNLQVMILWVVDSSLGGFDPR